MGLMVALWLKNNWPYIAMVVGVATVLIIWQETNWLARPAEEDRWRK